MKTRRLGTTDIQAPVIHTRWRPCLTRLIRVVPARACKIRGPLVHGGARHSHSSFTRACKIRGPLMHRGGASAIASDRR